MKTLDCRSIVSLTFVMLMAGSSALRAQTFPENFSQVPVATTISNPTAMVFAPDGRIFVTQQDGALIVIKNGVKLPQPALKLSVSSSGERGLVGIALDPGFSTNGFIYLYYTVPDGSHNRASRFTMSDDVINPASENVMLDFDPLRSSIHNGGAMHFKGDKLYIAIGENSYGPHAQNLDTYHGKLLRVNADGSAPADNPFNSSGASEKRKRVWAYGLRNPFTFDIQPGTGRIFVNDVGKNAWEEIDDATFGGRNFGWPTTEGATTDPAFITPVFYYAHRSGEWRGCAITGGVFFNPSITNYPAVFIGKYFFQDLCTGWINYLDLSSGVVRNTFAIGLPGQSLGLDVGIDGNLYYLSRSEGTLYKIIFSENQSPIITSQPDNVSAPEGQPATFQVTASGAAPLNYQWQRNSVNIPAATLPTYTIPAVLPSDAGDYQVVVSNAAGSVISQIATLTVTAFNASPVATILLPTAGAMYRGGDIINFSGSATDPEVGTLPDTAFSWSLVFHHGNHVHDGPPIAEGVRSGSFTIPRIGETSADVFYRLHLTVMDSGGLTTTISVDIKPFKTIITLNSSPPGLSVTLDGQPVITPSSTLGVEGINRTLTVVSPQTIDAITYAFAGWAHGGAITQTIATPEPDTTYTANFNGLPSPWITTNIGSAAIPGIANFKDLTFTTASSGWDIWNASDGFRYVYQQVSGDVEILALVTGLSNTNAWATAGVMIREKLNSDSKHATVAVTPGNGTAFLMRTSTGSSTSRTSAPGSVPYWLRLIRNGDTFTAYRSSNGIGWNQIGSVAISMMDNVFVGMAVSSHNDNSLCTATFTDVAITDGGGSVVLAVEGALVNGEMAVFPNPLNDNLLHVEFTLADRTAVRIQLINLMGQVIVEKNLGTREAGMSTYELDLAGYSKGTYVVRLLSEKGDKAAFLIKN